MIIRVVFEDDERGTFAYERDAEDAFKWRLTVLAGQELRHGGTHDGRDVVWNLALAVAEGTQDPDRIARILAGESGGA